MPLNETSRKPRRERHPLQFDLLGIPRSPAVRDQLLEVIQDVIQEKQMNTNSFAVDKAAGMPNLNPQQQAMLTSLIDSFISGGQGKEFDLSKPPVAPYRNNQFPRMVYRHDTGHVVTVHDENQMQLAQKKGFQMKPSPNHDYSQVKNGIAAVKMPAAARPEQISVADLVDEELSEQAKAAADAAYAETNEQLAALDDATDTPDANVAEDAVEESRPRRKR